MLAVALDVKSTRRTSVDGVRNDEIDETIQNGSSTSGVRLPDGNGFESHWPSHFP